MNVWYQPPFYGNCVLNFLQANSSVPGYRPVEFQPSHNQTKGYTKTGTYSSPKREKEKNPTNKKPQQNKIAWDTILNCKYFVAVYFCTYKRTGRKENKVYINWYYNCTQHPIWILTSWSWSAQYTSYFFTIHLLLLFYSQCSDTWKRIYYIIKMIFYHVMKYSGDYLLWSW